MSIIATAIAFVFALGFTTRALDTYWTGPAKYRTVYLLLGLMVGAIGYLIVAECFKLSATSLDSPAFFLFMLATDCLCATVAMLGMQFAEYARKFLAVPKRT